MATRFVALLSATLLAACTSAGTSIQAPAQQEYSFRVAVVGDFGSGNSAQDSIARMLRNRFADAPFDAFVTTGDNIYPSGQPSGFWQRWRRPYGWVQRNGVQVIASLGNHDIVTDRGRPVMELLDMPGRWFARRVGDAEVFVLDANQPRNPRQKQWLQSRLTRSDAAWQIVSFHQPPFSCGPHGGDPLVREHLVPILESGGADLVLNGHDHSYERFARRRGVTYIVTGGGGASLYPLQRCSGSPRLKFGRSVHHALIVAGNAQSLRVRAITPSGVIDQIVLRQAQ